MNNQFKPFRLINRLESRKLEQGFANDLHVWNEQNALFPLSLSLNGQLEPDALDNGYLFVTEQQTVALLPKQDLSALTHCLFGELSDCFKSISETQLIVLLKQVLGIQSLQRLSLKN